MQFIGELAALGSAFVWAVSMCMVSHFGKNYSARALNFFKNFTALFFVGLACLWSGSFSNMSAKLAIYAMISGVVGLSIADTALFVALKKLGAQLTSAIQTLSPPFTVLIALACLGETLVPKEIQGLIFTVSCVALAIIFSPKSAHLSQELHYRKHKSLGVLLAVFAALGNAVGIVLMRNVMVDGDVFAATFFRLLAAAGGLWVYSLTQRKEARVQNKIMHIIFSDKKLAFLLILTSFFGTFVGLSLMSFATKYTKAGIAAAISCAYPILVIPVERIFFGVKTSLLSILFSIGAVLGVIWMMMAKL